jgi:hypothetical protein
MDELSFSTGTIVTWDDETTIEKRINVIPSGNGFCKIRDGSCVQYAESLAGRARPVATVLFQPQ